MNDVWNFSNSNNFIDDDDDYKSSILAEHGLLQSVPTTPSYAAMDSAESFASWPQSSSGATVVPDKSSEWWDQGAMLELDITQEEFGTRDTKDNEGVYCIPIIILKGQCHEIVVEVRKAWNAASEGVNKGQRIIFVVV
jgi:hypothetical protein